MSSTANGNDVRVLLLPPTPRDAIAIRKLLAAAGTPCVVCGTMAELTDEAGRGAGIVLVSEEALTAEPDGWIASVRSQPVWSDLPLIVLSRSGVEPPKLTAILPHLGNVSVIERPVRLTTFLSLVRSALRGRARQYEVRDRLKQLEVAGEALETEQARYRDLVAAFSTLLDHAPFGVYVVDAQMRMYSVNTGGQQAFANVEPLIGRDFGEVMRILWPESFAAEAVRLFAHTLATGEPYVAPTLTEVRADLASQESYEWELHRVTLPGNQFGVVCYFYDTTRLRKVEFKLREAQRKVEAAMLAGEVGTYYWDIIGDRLSGDANFNNMFGVPLDDEGFAPVDAFLGVIHPDDQEAVREQIAQTLAVDALFRAEYRIRHPHGERWVIARGIVDRNADGTPHSWAGVVVDITERRRAEEERTGLLASERAARADAERAGRIKDEFLATLSHELRTPLSAILGWSEVLKMPNRSTADVEQGLQTIERNARAQTRIIEDLLDMSRIISGKVRLELQRVALAPVVRAAVDTIRPTADAKGVTLTVEVDADVGEFSGDPNRLQQVFWNLLSNAVKFTPRGRQVRVVAARTDSHMLVSVIDTGDGIPTDFLPLVFDRFRQADASTTRHHGGLGLGLAIVKQLVELHGGRVRAESAGPGMGATFVVKLPIAAVHVGGEVATDASADANDSVDRRQTPLADLTGLRVVVVDDEPDSRALIKRILENANASVIAVGSAAEAFDLVVKTRPDLLVSDIGMPGEDGYSLIRRIRARPPAEGGATPAIALTAYARVEDKALALGAGFQHHIVKPVEPSGLVDAVAGMRNSDKP